MSTAATQQLEANNSNNYDTNHTMVSTLTGRLLAGNCSDSILKKRKIEQQEPANTCGGSSGYSADDDQISNALPPFYVDFQAKREEESKSVSSNNASVLPLHHSNKRQKALEREYLAQNIAMELARGGLEMPKMRLHSARILPPLCAIDMSRVSLVYSKDFSFRNPFCDYTKNDSKNTYNEKTITTNKTTLNHEICARSIQSLTEACKYFYQLPVDQKSTEGDRTDDQSSASSVTDSDTEDESAKLIKKQPESVMTMCDALSLCKQPRIVVLSSAPYTIVHVNAAYLNMTGLSSVRLLGQPFQELIQDGKWVAALNSGITADGNPFGLGELNQQVIKTRTGTQKCSALKCTVSASPIGTSVDRITHFALGLEIFEGKKAQGNHREEQAPAMTVSG